MNWVEITVGVIFLFCVVMGIYRGAIRIAVSLATTLLTLVLVVFAAPRVSGLIEDFTPIDDMIRARVSSAMMNAAAERLTGGIPEGGLSKAQVRGLLKEAGISEDTLESYGVSVNDIAEGKIDSDLLAQLGLDEALRGMAESEGADADGLAGRLEESRDLQQEAIRSADLPDVFKDLLMTNNNDVIYEELGAESFAQYVGDFLAKLIIHILSFLAVFLLVTIIVRAIVFALDIVSELPGLGALNRLAGGAAGALGALIIIWTLFIIVTLLYTAQIGKDIYVSIQEQPILKMIYDYNPIMKLAAKI